MAKAKIKDITISVLKPFLDENGLELYHVEFVKEGKDKYLRVFLDKKNGDKEEYISIDDCEKVSRYLSDKLDESDPIEDNYILEVSSPGLDRILYTEADYTRFSGRLVDVGLYKPLNGSKQLSGELIGMSEGEVRIKTADGQEITVPTEQITKTRLAVVF